MMKHSRCLSSCQSVCRMCGLHWAIILCGYMQFYLIGAKNQCMHFISGGNFPLPEAGADCEVPQGYRMVRWNNLEGQIVKKK